MSRPLSSRRQFLQTSAAATAGLALPYFVPRTAFGANDRILTGHIGVGNQGRGNLKLCAQHAAAVCEVDAKRRDEAVQQGAALGRRLYAYSDYRKLLDNKDIDAVVITTPDHWHTAQTIHACQAGKDVYCEKPLTLTIAEGRLIAEAAKRHQRIVQTGSQQRSCDNFRYACELVRAGKIGRVEQVFVGLPGVNFKGPAVPDSTPPEELDYNFWLGPAPERIYNVNRVHYNFRFFWDYSGGQMTNFGAHHIDIAQWGLGADDTGPIEIEGTAEFHPQRWYEVTSSCRINMKYASGTVLTVGQEQPDIAGGTLFVGTTGRIFVSRGKLTGTIPELTNYALNPKDSGQPAHFANFFDSMRTRQQPICHPEVGHRSATACHLANLSVRLGRKLRWDPIKEEIIGDSEAAALVSKTYRAPFTL